MSDLGILEQTLLHIINVPVACACVSVIAKFRLPPQHPNLKTDTASVGTSLRTASPFSQCKEV